MKRAKIEWATLILGTWVVLGVTFAAASFVNKIVQFARTVPRDDITGFAAIQVITYLLVALGFFCLFIWSFLKGDFRDMEKSKYRVLEMEDRINEGRGGRG